MTSKFLEVVFSLDGGASESDFRISMKSVFCFMFDEKVDDEAPRGDKITPT